MKIRWCRYILISCAVLPYLAAKPFSLNEALAAESQQKQHLETTSRPKLAETTAKRFSLIKTPRINPLKRKKLKLKESIITGGKKISSLKYRKSFQIKSPLKPKRVKYVKRPRYKYKNQSVKREISNNEKFNRKYIPLLKSLGMLFDNLLTDSGESNEDKNKYRRKHSEERTNVVCKCTRKSDAETRTQPPEETIATTQTVTTEITIINKPTGFKTPTTTTDYTPTSDVSSLGQDKNLPLLSARNTASGRGNDPGLSERSRPTFHRSIERDIPRDHRNSEHNTGYGENGSSTEYDEEDSDGATRNGADRSKIEGRGVRGDRVGSRLRIGGDATGEVDELTKIESSVRGDTNKLEGQDNLKIRGDEAVFIPEFVPARNGGPGRSVPEDKDSALTKPVQSKKVGEKGVYGVTHNIASNQRLADRNGALTAEDQETSPANEAVITIKNLPDPMMLQNSPKYKAPFVTIFDGYSVARDKNGKNKLSEKSIRIHS